MKYESMLRDCFREQDDIIASCFERVARRNARLTKTAGGRGWHPTPTPRQTFIRLLDSTAEWTKMAELTDGCLSAADDSDLLVATCVEWASSSYRHGHARVYIAARILRRWSKKGVGIEPPIMNFLATCPNLGRIHKGKTYRLLAELIRSRHFLVGKYLQWLMARGTLTKHGRPDRVSKCFLW